MTIERARLLDLLLSGSNPNWLIEAGHGFGKSTLLDALASDARPTPAIVVRLHSSTSPDQLRSAIERAARGSAFDLDLVGLDAQQLADALVDCARPLAIDDSHWLDDDAAAMVAELVNHLRGHLPIVLAARLLPLRLRPLRNERSWRQLGSNELALSPSEVVAALAAHGVTAEQQVTVIERMTRGWPAAVDTAGERLAAADNTAAELQRLSQQDSLCEQILQPLVDSLSPADQQTACTVAALPFFDHALFDEMGEPGGLERIALAGLPLVRDASGWIEYTEPARSVLGRAKTTPKLADVVLDYYVRKGEIHAAINACLAIGDREGAASVIADLDSDSQARLDPARLDGAMASIGTAAEHAPRSLYVHSRVSAANGRQADGLAQIERAADVFESRNADLHDPAYAEVQLTLGTWRVYQGRLAEARTIAERCQAHLDGVDAPALQAMLHDLNGVLFQVSGTDEHLAKAAEEMAAALAIWRRIGRPGDAAVTTFRVSSGVLERQGRFAEALAMLDALPQVGPMTMLTTARLGVNRALLLPFVGRAAEVTALLEEPRQVAEALGQRQLTSTALIAEIVAASVRYDADAVRATADAFLAGGHLLPEQGFSAVMWAEVVRALARCELHDESMAALDRIRETPGLPPWILQYMQASIDARTGDAEAAIEVLSDLATQEEVQPNSRWTVDLLRAHAYWRLGNAAEAAKFLDQANNQAAALEQPGLARFIESRLVDRIEGTQNIVEPATTAAVSVSLFDEFSVLVNGQEAPLRPGQPTNLVKVLGIGGGTLVVDQIVDALWPEADLEVGRRRLRNVVKRVRDDCGPILVRNDDVISFSSDVAVDLDFARAAADNAFAARSPESVNLALTLNDRALLPVDRYEDWAEDARSDHLVTVLRLLDLRAELHVADQDVSALTATIERGLELDPMSVSRVRSAARSLRSIGADETAVRLEEQFAL